MEGERERERERVEGGRGGREGEREREWKEGAWQCNMASCQLRYRAVASSQ